MSIKLYDLAGAEPERRFSPYCWRTKLALAHKGLSVETIPWHFTEKQAIAASGQERVPVLLDGDRVVWDSWTIANYLEDRYADKPSLFGGAAGRALSLTINNWADTVLIMGIVRFVLLDIYQHIDERDKAYFRSSREGRLGTKLEDFVAERDKYLRPFQQSLEPIRKTLAAQSFLGGDQPLYADYIIFGSFLWPRAISSFKLLEPSDPIYAWRERMMDQLGGIARKAPGYPL